MGKKYNTPQDNNPEMASEPVPAYNYESHMNLHVLTPGFSDDLDDEEWDMGEPMTEEEFQARIDSYDEIDENDESLWCSFEDFDSEIRQYIKDYAVKVGKAF